MSSNSTNAIMTNAAPFEAIQDIRKMRGGSQSHLMLASDRNYYVVKCTDNPQCNRVLANEYIGSHLGRLLGLPMPETRVIEVSEWLIQNSPDLCFESGGHKVPCQPGQHLAIRYAVDDPHTHNVFDYLPESLAPRILNITDFARCLVADKWACNCDGRQAIFSRRVNCRYYHVSFIDQGYYFNAGEWTFPDLALHGVYYRNYVYQHVTGWEDFEPALSRVEEMRIDDLWIAANGIPQNWYHEHTGALVQLLENLHQRRSRIRNLITDFRKSQRNPFPNWKDVAMVSVPAIPTDSGECRA